jgi:hypothetical protein
MRAAVRKDSCADSRSLANRFDTYVRMCCTSRYYGYARQPRTQAATGSESGAAPVIPEVAEQLRIARGADRDDDAGVESNR